ncbi:MAG TPA: FlgD immunoglobulin-like domain containing protein, partial [Candidatus Eisenbacteria bacterium]|nr:FlgD immunoglobulin-like domain containing protein [Candidatus Eisenbacteria bacterium]
LFDASGRLVRRLAAGRAGAGGYRDVPFDGRDAEGRALRSGIYFYRVESMSETASGRFVLVR